MAPPPQLAEWAHLYDEIDALTGGWLRHAQHLLEACSERLGSGGSEVVAAEGLAGHSSGAVAREPTGRAHGDGGEGVAAIDQPHQHEGRLFSPGAVGGSADGVVEVGAGESGVVHVAVTTGQLTPSLAKLLLFRLDPHFPPENVYSARAAGKPDCFQRIKKRFGEGCRYLAVGVCVGVVERQQRITAQHALPHKLLLPAPLCSPPPKEKKKKKETPSARTHHAGDGPEEEVAADLEGMPFLRITLSPIPTSIPLLPVGVTAAGGEDEEGVEARLDASGSKGRPLTMINVELIEGVLRSWQRVPVG